MIVNQDVHPQRKIYYWGALVIDVLHQFSDAKISYFKVYEEMKRNHDISIESFSLALDWLFILGVIDGKGGYIKKCF